MLISTNIPQISFQTGEFHDIFCDPSRPIWMFPFTLYQAGISTYTTTLSEDMKSKNLNEDVFTMSRFLNWRHALDTDLAYLRVSQIHMLKPEMIVIRSSDKKGEETVMWPIDEEIKFIQEETW